MYKWSQIFLIKTSSVKIPYFSTYLLKCGVSWHTQLKQVCTNCVIALLWPPYANLKSVAVDDLYPLDFLSRRPKSWQQWKLVTSIPEESAKRPPSPYWAYTWRHQAVLSMSSSLFQEKNEDRAALSPCSQQLLTHSKLQLQPARHLRTIPYLCRFKFYFEKSFYLVS